MKSVRLCLVLLLMVLLPVRGALAVAMQCAGSVTSVPASVELSVGAHDHHASASTGHGHHHDQAASGHEHGHQPSAAEVHASPDTCNLCASGCCAAAIVSSAPAVAEPRLVAAAFPHLIAPAPSFISGGQERPPRSI